MSMKCMAYLKDVNESKCDGGGIKEERKEHDCDGRSKVNISLVRV